MKTEFESKIRAYFQDVKDANISYRRELTGELHYEWIGVQYGDREITVESFPYTGEFQVIHTVGKQHTMVTPVPKSLDEVISVFSTLHEKAA
ncbi:MAG TPA: hypothetical protein VLJ21_00760 [Candidatus Binatia bacterium]|nr:hypothetical protein [Candidatus Binatia bacterium]